MATSILVNGQNLTTIYGLAVDGLPQWRSAPKSVRQRYQVIGRAGSMRSAPVRTPDRTLRVTGSLQQSTAALELSNEDAVKSLLTAGLIRLAVNDGSTFARQVEGYAENVEVDSFGQSMAPLTTRWSFDLPCGPYWQTAEPNIRVLSSTSVRYTLPLGTAPSFPKIAILGTASSPTLTYRDAGGATIRTSQYSSLASGNDWYDINMLTGVNTQYLSGSASVLGLPVGDWVWAFDPQDGDYETAQWPTLQISAGTAIAYWWNNYL